MSDLTEITGIADATAETLADAGIDSPSTLAAAPTEEVVDAVSHWGEDDATTAISEAAEMAGVADKDETETETLDTGATAQEHSPDPVPQIDTLDTTYTVTRDECYQVLDVVLNEVTEQRANSNQELLEYAQDVADLLMHVLRADTGDEIEIPIPASSDHQVAFRRALAQGYSTYMSTPGLTSVYGTLNELKELIDEERS